MTGTRLEGSVCLVTGATGGIGRAAARELARRGAAVNVSGRDEAGLEEAAAETGGRAFRADLTAPGAAATLAAEAGEVDVLVHAAGAGAYGPVTALTDGRIEQLVTLNVTATVALTAALLPGMLARGRGHVVLIGSILGRLGRRRESLYAASKAATSVFADSLRDELRGTGVGVTLVTPGVVETPFFARRGADYDRRWPRPIAPETVARALADAVESGRGEVVVPRWLSLAVRARGAAPDLYRAVVARFD